MLNRFIIHNQAAPFLYR